MTLTLHDIKPIGLCITTEDLFDTKKFLYSFCDSLILRGKDITLKNNLTTMKREMNAIMSRNKFFDGYKAIITSNIEKILCIVSSRYDRVEPKTVERIMMNGKDLIKKILKTNSFEEILSLESEFKTKISLPTYELFLTGLKRSKVDII